MHTVPFDTGELSFELPPGWRGRVVESKTAPPIEDVPAAVAEAIARPVNSPPLRELARPGDKVCVVFTDVTRASPDYLLVPPILAELEKAGIHDKDITLLITESNPKLLNTFADVTLTIERGEIESRPSA